MPQHFKPDAALLYNSTCIRTRVAEEKGDEGRKSKYPEGGEETGVGEKWSDQPSSRYMYACGRVPSHFIAHVTVVMQLSVAHRELSGGGLNVICLRQY